MLGRSGKARRKLVLWSPKDSGRNSLVLAVRDGGGLEIGQDHGRKRLVCPCALVPLSYLPGKGARGWMDSRLVLVLFNLARGLSLRSARKVRSAPSVIQ